MNDRDRVGVRQQLVVQGKRIRGRFERHRILEREMLALPVIQVGQLHPLGTQDLVEFRIHAEGDQIMLVDIQTDETRGDCLFFRHGGRLFFKLAGAPDPQGRARPLRERNLTHRYGLDG